jgi:hypothetical protein
MMDPELQPWIDRYELAVTFAQAMIEELGEPRALTILAKAFEKLQMKVGRDLATQLGDNSLQALAEHTRRKAAGSSTREIVEITDRHIATRISQCPAPAAFAALGAPDLCRLYCDSDYAYIKAFNPNMRMVRTRTIAAGDPYCNHIWVLDRPAEDEE